MIKCKICGHEVKYRLIEHIIKVHNISINEYKINYGDVVSEEYRKKVSDKSKEKWKEEEYKEKTLSSRNWIYEDKEIQEKRKKSILKYYENGGKVWNYGLTKNDDMRLLSVGEKNKNHLTGRNKQNYSYLMNHSERMKKLWDNSNIKYKWETIQKDDKLKNEWKDKISITLTNKILNGEIKTHNNFNNGWYENKYGKYWYASSLEKEAMYLFDTMNIKWNSNNIKIRYKDKEGNYRYYIPDFEIELFNKKIIIEMKGYDWDGLTDIKEKYTKEKYEYYIFYDIEKLKKFIKNYENDKN